MIVTSVQIKTVKTQKHLYCPVFTLRKASVINALRHFDTGFFYRFLLSAFCFAKALLPCLIVFHGVVSQTFVQHERGNIGGLF